MTAQTSAVDLMLAAECPRCEHPRSARTASQRWRRLLHLPLKPAECAERVLEGAGFPEPCGCTDPFHGS